MVVVDDWICCHCELAERQMTANDDSFSTVSDVHTVVGFMCFKDDDDDDDD